MGNLMGNHQTLSTVGQSASRISHLPPKGEVGNVEGSPGNSRFPPFPLPDGKRETGKRETGNTTCMQDLRKTMQQAKTVKGMRTILKIATRRLEDIQFIGWPALEASLQAELDDCREIAARRMQEGKVTP